MIAPTRNDQHPIPQEPRIRLCHVAATTDGAAWLVTQLRELRDRHGYDVSAVIASGPGQLGDRLRAAGIETLQFDFRISSPRDLMHLPWSVIRLAWLLRRHRFDIIQTHLFPSMVIGRLAAWLADVPVRVTMVAGPFHLEAPLTRWVDSATCWMDSLVIGSCQSIIEMYRTLGVRPDRIKLAYYGPDETVFDPATTPPHDLRVEYGWPADTLVIAHVAWFYKRLSADRWVPETCQGRSFKGHEELIRATPAILREFPTARIVFIGSGWREDGARFMQEMVELVEQLGLQVNVIFTGARANVANIYQAVDVAAHPSLTESCGGTPESLLMERPTVATSVGGMPDLVIDGETGVLVRPADPEDLARGICALLRDPERGRALGKAGRARVLDRATLSKTITSLDAAYRDALSRHGRRPSGNRWWMSLLRLPILGGVGAYLAGRYVLSERLTPRRGQRPACIVRATS